MVDTVGNARLLAAASELLAACKELRAVLNMRCIHGESVADSPGGRIAASIDAADAAIAKAEGRS